MKTIPPPLSVCANWKDGDGICPNQGILTCGNCKLVVYCSHDCQVKHWNEHKKSCKSPLRKAHWLPAWDVERREPAWSYGEAATNAHNPFGMTKYLWGNTPAMDVLNLARNEGSAYGKDITVLFAASGDLRNVVKTIQSLPDQFHHQVKMTINDRDTCVPLRNAVILLLMLSSLEEISDQDSIDNLAESLIHVWYSAMITPKILSELQSKVKPLISEVCLRIAGKKAGALLGKTWTFKSGSSLRLVLKKEDWAQVLMFLEVPERLTTTKAREIRHATVLAPEREDYRDRWYFKDATPSMRVAKQRFREDGLLLGFGHPRLGFDCPNPTIFQVADSWPMDDKADPLDGWPGSEVRDTLYRAPEDVYGKLFFYIRRILGAFIRRVATGKVHFEVLNVDVTELGKHVGKNSYDRIEASNISDNCWLGTRETLRNLIPLLKTPHKNPHATLITVYLNAVMEIAGRDGPDNGKAVIDITMKHLKVQEMNVLFNPLGAEMHRIWDARCLIFDAKNFFHRYMAEHRFHQTAEELGVVMKTRNTVGEAWPTSLKLRPGQPGAHEEFHWALSSGVSGAERYVEWKRVS